MGVLLWLCFLARGLFYCSFLPLWEGYDEWAHFAYIERLTTRGALLVDRGECVSREVLRSLQLAPLPQEPWDLPKPSATHDEYWQLPPEARLERQERLRSIPPAWSREPVTSGPRIYEALQPPLYYWLLSGPYRLAGDAPLADRVFLLRYLSLAIASLAVPLVFLVALQVLRSPAAALGTAALLTAMPEFMIDVCRVGNECLGVVSFSGVILVSLNLVRDPVPRGTGILAGVLLGLGLLTKAYFLTAIPALGMLYAWRIWRARDKRAIVLHAMATFGLAFALAGWWFIHNRLTTGTWSGLSESVMLRSFTWRQMLDGIGAVHWWRALDSILVSHIWFGAWTGLMVRSWMYHVLFLVAALACAGVLLAVWRSTPDLRRLLYPLLVFYGFFWIGQLYNVLLLFLSKGVSTSMGWYMYCVIAAEAVLLVFGLYALVPGRARKGVLPFLVLCLAALDIYTIHFLSIPYYTGLIAHRPDGPLATFHLAQLAETGPREILARLAVNKPLWLTPAAICSLWAGYAIATLAAIGLSFRLIRFPSSPTPPASK